MDLLCSNHTYCCKVPVSYALPPTACQLLILPPPIPPTAILLGYLVPVSKGLKHVAALAGSEDPLATGVTQAPDPEEPPPGVGRDPAGASPTIAVTTTRQPGGEMPQDDSMGEEQAEPIREEKVGSTQEEKDILAGEEPAHEQVVKIDEPVQQQANPAPQQRGDLLLELIRSFRGGMLRVDSNLRAAMFRSLRYLVGELCARCSIFETFFLNVHAET